jgi:hypothetical protein
MRDAARFAARSPQFKAHSRTFTARCMHAQDKKEAAGRGLRSPTGDVCHGIAAAKKPAGVPLQAAIIATA